MDIAIKQLKFNDLTSLESYKTSNNELLVSTLPYFLAGSFFPCHMSLFLLNGQPHRIYIIPLYSYF